MKKKYTVLLLLSLTLSTAACHTQKKISYDFPPAMSDNIRAGYTELCDKGKVLYERTCARCHTILVKGRRVIPDFSPEQLTGYTIRVSNKRHETSMPDSLVSVEDLSLITTFLTYKQKNTFTKR